jgi:cytochrome-b5 reductase
MRLLLALTFYRCIPSTSTRLRGLNQAIHFQHRGLSHSSPGVRHDEYTRPRRVLTLGIAFGVVAGASLYLFLPDPSRSAPTSTKLSLSPSHFTPATIVSSESHGPDTKLLQLVVPPNLLRSYDASNPSFHPIWSVFIKDDDIQVERPYTPLEGIDDQKIP